MKVFGFFLLGMSFAAALVAVFVLAQNEDDKVVASKPEPFKVYNTYTTQEGSRWTYDDKGHLFIWAGGDGSTAVATPASDVKLARDVGVVQYSNGSGPLSFAPSVARLEAHYVNAERPAELTFSNKGVTVSLVAGIDGSLRFKHADGSTSSDLTDFSVLNAEEKTAIRDVIKAVAPK